jgi:sterol desaturase/sphingolipid hydroxylase (fatty acid hydroxylase superfamily)
LVIASTVAFLLLERAFPGRQLPHSKGWYGRAILVNLCQLAITVAMAKMWIRLFGNASLFNLSGLDMPVLEGFVGWFVGTFFFYWWHRLRHARGWWLVFHQIHHSPSRVELLTSFYKHPIEIFCDALLAAVIMYPLLGCSLLGAFWFNFFAGTGEYFYHANLRAPCWLRYVIQTPQLHSVHHQFNVHSYNYSDLPLWDRLFGTYKDTTQFADRCGFPEGAEGRLLQMLCFKDVYREREESSMASLGQ